MWDAERMIHPLPTLLPPENDDLNEASDINNHGDVVGVVATTDTFHAALWRGGRLTDLGAGDATRAPGCGGG